jgi:hypothetical protein
MAANCRFARCCRALWGPGSDPYRSVPTQVGTNYMEWPGLKELDQEEGAAGGCMAALCLDGMRCCARDGSYLLVCSDHSVKNATPPRRPTLQWSVANSVLLGLAGGGHASLASEQQYLFLSHRGSKPLLVGQYVVVIQADMGQPLVNIQVRRQLLFASTHACVVRCSHSKVAHLQTPS